MICKKCKKEIPDNSTYCLYCGKKQLTSMFCKLPGKMNDILNDSTNAFSADDSFGRSFTLIDHFLTKHTQDVVSDHSEFENKFIGVKLA